MSLEARWSTLPLVSHTKAMRNLRNSRRPNLARRPQTESQEKTTLAAGRLGSAPSYKAVTMNTTSCRVVALSRFSSSSQSLCENTSLVAWQQCAGLWFRGSPSRVTYPIRGSHATSECLDGWEGHFMRIVANSGNLPWIPRHSATYLEVCEELEEILRVCCPIAVEVGV